MPLKWTPQICDMLATMEDGQEVTAGVSLPEERETDHETPGKAGALALGRFVKLARRKAGLTEQQLAGVSGLEVEEVQGVEASIADACEPRVVIRLSKALKRPQKELLYLAGLMNPREVGVGYEGIKFAAHSDPSTALTHEEEVELSAFIQFLSTRLK